MKKIVRGNDFVMRIPVRKVVGGEQKPFPLPACTDVAVSLVGAYRRVRLEHEVDVADDSLLLARVEGDKIALGSYALEVKGKLFGNDWRSNEYEQVTIVDRNSEADTELGATDEGEPSVEMDTAIVIQTAAKDVPLATTESAGVVTVGDGLTVTEGRISAEVTAASLADAIAPLAEKKQVAADITAANEVLAAKIPTQVSALENDSGYIAKAASGDELLSVTGEKIDVVKPYFQGDVVGISSVVEYSDITSFYDVNSFSQIPVVVPGGYNTLVVGVVHENSIQDIISYDGPGALVCGSFSSLCIPEREEQKATNVFATDGTLFDMNTKADLVDGKVPLSQLGNIDTELFVVVTALPTEDIKTNKIYLVRHSSDGGMKDDMYIQIKPAPNDPVTGNVFDEYVYVRGAWELLGQVQTKIDLSGYATTESVATMTDEEIDAALAS